MFYPEHIQARWRAELAFRNEGKPAPSAAAYDFVAIDFETATRRADSACSIGLVAVKNGEIAERIYSLICPPDNNYETANIAVHGITPDMTVESPTLPELWPTISRFFEGETIIAHNAGFDVSVLKHSLMGMSIPDFWYFDSMNIAKGIVTGSRSLTSCTECLGITLEDHHNALADAEACAKVVLCCLAQSEVGSLEELYVQKKLDPHFYSDLHAPVEHKFQKTPSYAKARVQDIVPSVSSFDESAPLFGKTIVFTGTLRQSRTLAWQRAADAGAIVKNTISAKVDYLVVGKQDCEIVGADGMSGKEEKAYALNESGKGHIEIIDEDKFLALVGK